MGGPACWFAEAADGVRRSCMAACLIRSPGDRAARSAEPSHPVEVELSAAPSVRRCCPASFRLFRWIDRAFCTPVTAASATFSRDAPAAWAVSPAARVSGVFSPLSCRASSSRNLAVSFRPARSFPFLRLSFCCSAFWRVLMSRLCSRMSGIDGTSSLKNKSHGAIYFD